jgi:peptide chain release factor subunit 1
VDKNEIRFKKLLEELDGYRGRHTELVTVLVPEGYDLNLIMNQLAQERGTAENIKSKNTRQNVTTALDKLMQRLTLFKKTPEHGLAIFSGNVGDEQNDEWIVESIIPPEPLQTRAYRCDQEFFLEPLKEMLRPKNIYGLIAIERGGATIGLLKGKRIEVSREIGSIVPGKFRAGGQSAGRFERVREGMAKDFYKEVSERVLEGVDGILLGGPGPTKEEFHNVLPRKLQEKVLTVQDLGYSDEQGLRELVAKSESVLAKTELVHEKKVLDNFFKRIAKGQPVEYGKAAVKKALKMGSAGTVLLSEELPKKTIDEFLDLAENVSAEVEFISADTSEGKEFLAMGGFGALLRYA